MTPWVRQADGVIRAIPLAPDDVRGPDLRFTVDTPDDSAYVRRLAADLDHHRADPRLAGLADVIAASRRLVARGVA